MKNPECSQIVYDVNRTDEETKSKMEKYEIKSVPTISLMASTR